MNKRICVYFNVILKLFICRGFAVRLVSFTIKCVNRDYLNKYFENIYDIMKPKFSRKLELNPCPSYSVFNR